MIASRFNISVVDLYAYIVYIVGMNTVQYTIRGIPKDLDAMIRKRAARTGKSFNKTVVEILSTEVTGSTTLSKDTIFDKLRGANLLDEGFDEAIVDQSQVDPELWK